MNRKGGMPIAAAFFAVLTVVLLVFAWFTFLTRSADLEVNIQSSEIMSRVYAREALINFYVQKSVEKAAGESGEDKSIFLSAFEKDLKDKRIEQILPEMNDVYIQLGEQRVRIDGKNIYLKLKLKIDEGAFVEEHEIVHVEYVYEKEFYAELNNQEG